jgi:hypothetical protein
LDFWNRTDELPGNKSDNNNVQKTSLGCPNCMPGDSLPNSNPDKTTYLYDANGQKIDTIKRDPTTNQTDVVPIK